MNTNLKRRDFLRVVSTASAGLVVGFYLPSKQYANRPPEAAAESFAPNAWLKIDTNGAVTITVARSELGQGVRTSLPMIVAEELEADWSKVEIVQAPFDKRFGEQGTGGSTSIRTSWGPLRKAGATAREMLLAAAAQTWDVEKSTCRAEGGVIVHTSTSRRLTYGALVETAAKLSVPKDVPLKDPKDFRIVGTSVPRTDTPSKVEGSAVFGIDVRVSGMLYATVVRCRVFGGKVASFDATKAKAVPGVRHVIQIGERIAVVAENTWVALKGREALVVKWNEGPNASESAASLRRQFEELTSKPARAFRNDGDVEAALAGLQSALMLSTRSPTLPTRRWSRPTALRMCERTAVRSGRRHKVLSGCTTRRSGSPACRTKRFVLTLRFLAALSADAGSLLRWKMRSRSQKLSARLYRRSGRARTISSTVSIVPPATTE